MSVERIDALMMKKCFLAGAKALESRKDYINELNVFPVPDGDTGTNMTMTIMAAVREINKLQDVTVDSLCKAMSSGSLRGARGNSGVIMSQIFRGFTKELKGLEYLEVTDLGNSIQHAADTAYKAVMKPKEGTILTVIKAGAERSVELLMEGESHDMVSFAEEVSAYMEDTLKRTPDMLPVLKQAGVVDSGGEGLMTFVRGALAALQGKEVDLDLTGVDAKASPAVTTGTSEDAADIKFGYCTEFIIMLERDQDKVEKEPRGLLWKIFLFGVLSVIPAMILEIILDEVFLVFVDADTLCYVILDNFIGVALIEELCKMKAAKWAAWKHPAFNYKFDAIVYCVTSALGFAAIENVLYCLGGDFGTAVTRALLSVPSHAIDGVIMGYFFGVAKEAELAGDKKRRKRYLKLSVFMPMIEHGIYDSALSLDADWIFVFFFLFVIVVDVWAYKFVKKQSGQDRELSA